MLLGVSCVVSCEEAESGAEILFQEPQLLFTCKHRAVAGDGWHFAEWRDDPEVLSQRAVANERDSQLQPGHSVLICGQSGEPPQFEAGEIGIGRQHESSSSGGFPRRLHVFGEFCHSDTIGYFNNTGER